MLFRSLVDLGAFAMLLVDLNVSVCLQITSHTPQLLLGSLDLPLALDLQLLSALQAYQEVILAEAG